MTVLRRFLLICAGASARLMATCPETEHIKYQRIGVFVLLASTTAAGAMTYAVLRIVDGSLMPALIIGAMYGIFVFTLDGYLLTTLRRRTRRNVVGHAALRIAIAVVIATVVATPLELRVVRDRVARQREVQRQQAIEHDRRFYETATGFAQARNQLAEQRTLLEGLMSRLGEDPPGEAFKVDLRRTDECHIRLREATVVYQQQNRQFSGRINAIDEELANASNQDRIVLQLERARLTNRLVSARDALRRNQAECKQLADLVQSQRQSHLERLETQRATTEAAVRNIQNVQEVARERAGQEIAAARAVTDQAFGGNLVTELEALWILMSSSVAVWWTCLGLWAFLISIDVTPIVAKVISGHGPYDLAVETEEAAANALHRAELRVAAEWEEPALLEAIRLQHQRDAELKELSSYLHIVIQATRHVQEQNERFEDVMQQLLRAAYRTGTGENAHEMERLLRDLRVMFVTAREKALGDFAARIRQSHGAD